jgi:hypothetical protein
MLPVSFASVGVLVCGKIRVWGADLPLNQTIPYPYESTILQGVNHTPHPDHEKTGKYINIQLVSVILYTPIT